MSNKAFVSGCVLVFLFGLGNILGFEIDNREAQTEVLVRDGETLVIGGIYETDQTETEQGIPWLMKIPVLGWLFKNQEKTSTKRELLIFITPRIIKD